MQAKRILLQTKATGRTGCANRKKYVIKNHEASGNFFFVPNLIARLFLSEMIHSFHQTSNDQSNSKAGLATLSCTSVRHFAFLQRRRRKPFFDWAVPQEAQLQGYNSNSLFISSFFPPENGVVAKFVSPAKLTFLVKCSTQMTFVPENVVNSKEQAISLFPFLPLIPYVTHVTSSPRQDQNHPCVIHVDVLFLNSVTVTDVM